MTRAWGWIIGLASLALAAGCGSGKQAGPAMDETMRLARESAAAEYAAGSYDAAAGEWRRALARAYVLGDAQGAGLARYQLGACALAQGRLEEGRTLLAGAALEAAAAGEADLAARAEAAEARVVLRQGRPEEARDLARRGLARVKPGGKGGAEGDLRLVLAESLAALPEGAPEARTELERALKAGGREPGPAFKATAARVRGALLEKEGSAGGAALAFEEEAGQWRAAGRHAEQAAALGRAGELRMKAGDWQGASLRMLEGARIHAGLGQAEKARSGAGRAADWLKAGLETDDPAGAVRERLEALLRLAQDLYKSDLLF